MFRHQRFREQTGVAGAAIRLIRPACNVYQRPASVAVTTAASGSICGETPVMHASKLKSPVGALVRRLPLLRTFHAGVPCTLQRNRRKPNTPGRIRTSNLRLRKPTIYPVDLRGRVVFFGDVVSVPKKAFRKSDTR